MRPFRFGLHGSTARSLREWTDLARRVEGSGFSTLQVSDHLTKLAPLPALTAAAVVTTTLRLGTFVLTNDMRRPSVLARDCATLELLSDGRLELGLGAGWDAGEYDRLGVPFRPAAARVRRLADALPVIRHALASVPIMVGGGSRRVLELAAREADIVSVSYNMASGRTSGPVSRAITATGTSTRVGEKLRWVRDAARERLAEPELNLPVFLLEVTDDRDAVARGLAHVLGMSPEEVLTLPFVLIGSVDECVAACIERRELYGFSYVSLPARSFPACIEIARRLSGS